MGLKIKPDSQYDDKAYDWEHVCKTPGVYRTNVGDQYIISTGTLYGQFARSVVGGSHIVAACQIIDNVHAWNKYQYYRTGYNFSISVDADGKVDIKFEGSPNNYRKAKIGDLPYGTVINWTDEFKHNTKHNPCLVMFEGLVSLKNPGSTWDRSCKGEIVNVVGTLEYTP